MDYVETITYSFKHNGETIGSITPSRRLRQADPISPYLFLIYTEGLSSLIRGAIAIANILGFKCSRRCSIISHLFFIDDSLLFTRANDRNCLDVLRILETYSRASSHVVNYNKYVMCFSASMPARKWGRLASIMGVNRVECHVKYMGLPCFSCRNKRTIFTDIVDRIWGKAGGKEIIIKAVVQSIPTYSMSLFKLPENLIDEIIGFVPVFGGGDEKRRKMYWSAWLRLCKTKVEGGLGFKDLYVFNRALLTKQCWRIIKNPKSLASRILKDCYFSNGKFMNATKKSSSFFCMWNSLLWGKRLIDRVLRWRVGNCKSIHVYEDNWILRPNTLKVISPSSLDAERTVSNLMSPSGG
ncbi:hypothetical protein Ddye_024175 [Dipteronia dyeriana]|uniref:Reverse transcriptase domain-containing protein n=1 Tax=Dipteronia dyeriana TaxID=168575 RepID=A0AAD9TUD8_9ROSI|nr:hypothetical protein Ddye_024175 [Dipteronia dyeriana]